jgi:serine/threonine-protein kinase
VSATATAGAFGSQGYRSPEEREGRPASTRSDVFSVGIVLHEMLTGTRPSSAPLPASAPGVPPSTAHPDLRGAHDRLLARMTATDPESRPPDAFAARTEIEGLAWPSRLRPRSEGERAEAAYDGAAPPRLQVRRDGTEFDTWTGRAIERVPLSDDLLVRARAFAAVSHAGLQPVLRVDREGATLGGTLWMLHLPARDPWLRLSPREHAGLADAVRALHAHGIVHGAVNAAHLAFAETSARDREAIGDDDRPPIVLRFSPPPPPGATFADDLADLARLA